MEIYSPKAPAIGEPLQIGKAGFGIQAILAQAATPTEATCYYRPRYQGTMQATDCMSMSKTEKQFFGVLEGIARRET